MILRELPLTYEKRCGKETKSLACEAGPRETETMNNLTHAPKGDQYRAALVACRDTRSQVESVARYIGMETGGLLILSRADDPRLRTIDDIVAALPATVTLLGLDDVEFLLPEGERSLSNVHLLLQNAYVRYVHRGLNFAATMTLATGMSIGLVLRRCS